MDERDAAQAAELVRGLRGQLHKMTNELVRLERQHVSGTSSQASAIRREAAVLRRDIAEAQSHIDRLQRRYLSGGERIQQRSAGGPPRATVTLRAK
jgi:hypothetical protein